MKFISIIILSLLFLTQTFSKWMILMEYQVNRDFIARELCENKSRPMLHCNGKCQLNKKLAADNEQNNTTSNHNSNTSLSEILFVNPLPDFNLSGRFDNIQTVYPDYLIAAYIAPVSSIFHPPSVA